jgi:hypothetical protein
MRRRIAPLLIALLAAFLAFAAGRRLRLPTPAAQVAAVVVGVVVLRRSRRLFAPRRESLAVDASAPLAELRRSLQESAAASSLGEPLRRAERQLTNVQELFQAFDHTLAARLSRTELTFERYRRPAESLYVGALDNLHAVATTARRLAGIDAAHAQARLQALRRGEGDEHARVEREALEERLRLHAEGMARIAALLAFNERASTALAAVTSALDQLETSRERAFDDLEKLVAELEILSQQTSRYDER